MSAVGTVDGFQRRHRVVGFPLAVVYKYFDDQGPYLAAVITYYAFTAIFPLLLIASSVLGFLLQGDVELQETLLDSAVSQIPVVGPQLARPEGISGSGSAIVVGVLAALYGSLGVGQSLQNASNVAWSVPRNSRANPFLMRLRSLLLVGIVGLAVVALTVLTSVLPTLEPFKDEAAWVSRLLIPVTWALIWFVFMALFRLFAVVRPGWMRVAPGAAFVGAAWIALQQGGQAYVSGVVSRASELNSVFAVVLGLMAFIFLASCAVVLGLEINVVIARRLFPRALLTPFTDRVHLTEADRRAYALYAKAQRHKGFQSIDVHFRDEDDEHDASTPIGSA
ncbi:YihY/virulence factor BrkB family protein [Aeromicrobium sp. IC_218]|uniref:YihY/virulence factor BrkB family protein n=1 Tax=Aeromicrobium sp. IC_218 TaxID=2545468 RepID=UPI001038AAC6|nr:YihY/virulence factor BrkB family protein [Aeromicrobium sp. IC_218]TCI99020.1 YihY/virulence factor BrkB family protein [Aeromicrobium sp. IC_218]